MDIKDGITVGNKFYSPEGGCYIGGHQVSGHCDTPFRYVVGRLVRQKKISFKSALKQMLEAKTYGVYSDTKLKDI